MAKKFVYKVDRKLRAYGETDYDKKVIRINPGYKGKYAKTKSAQGDLMNTVVHEEMHRIHPDWGENKTKQVAKKKELSLSIKQAVKLLKKYQGGK
jgi:hypothetical protein